MRYLKRFEHKINEVKKRKPQTIELGEKVRYRDQICTVVFKKESGLYNLERPNGNYWYDVHPWYVEKLDDSNEI